MKKRSARDNYLRIVDYLGGRCYDCKKVFPIYVYDLHCSESRMDIKSFAGKKLRPFDEIKDDLDNCVLLCANCYRVRHHDER